MRRGLEDRRENAIKRHASFISGVALRADDCDLLSALARVRRVLLFLFFGSSEEARKVYRGRDFFRGSIARKS